MKKIFMIRILDVLVTILILLPLFFSAMLVGLLFFMPDKSQALMGIYETPYLHVLAIITCIVLLLWMIIGEGLKSNLWEWLPPLIFFKHFGIYSRMLLITLLIVGTLIGLCSQLFGW